VMDQPQERNGIAHILWFFIKSHINIEPDGVGWNQIQYRIHQVQNIDRAQRFFVRFDKLPEVPEVGHPGFSCGFFVIVQIAAHG
jgi:hypothetical protein